MCHPCAIMWEADVPPAVGRIAATPSLASLDQDLLGHSIWDEVCICPGLSKFSFSYRNIVGTGGFSGRAIMWPQDVVPLDMPSSHSHSLLALVDFLGGPSCGLGMLFYWICPLVTPTPTLLQLGFLLPLSTCHLTYPFGLVCFFPSPPAIHLPIPHCQVYQCFAHIKHLRHQHSTLAWFASSPLPCHLFICSPSPNRFLLQYMACILSGSFVCL